MWSPFFSFFERSSVLQKAETQHPLTDCQVRPSYQDVTISQSCPAPFKFVETLLLFFFIYIITSRVASFAKVHHLRSELLQCQCLCWFHVCRREKMKFNSMPTFVSVALAELWNCLKNLQNMITRKIKVTCGILWGKGSAFPSATHLQLSDLTCVMFVVVVKYLHFFWRHCHFSDGYCMLFSLGSYCLKRMLR